MVRIQASVHVGGDQAIAPPTSAQAFYEPENGRLILARPVSDRSWAHILNALFHQLMPEESGSEISKLTLSVRPLMGMTVEEAHRELSDAGIPYLDAEASSVGDLTSPDLDERSGATEPSSRKESDTAPAPDESSDKREPHLRGKERKPRTEDSAHQGRAEPSERPGRGEGSESSGRDASERNGSTTREGGSTRSVQGEQRAKKSRPKHKEQWDRRLLSYVRQKQETSSEPGDQEGPSEHNLAVEIVAREAVCAYERERGRVPEQMAQTHPGYDIISRNPMTGEDYSCIHWTGQLSLQCRREDRLAVCHPA